MSAFNCPHCHQPAISVGRKLLLGWARDVPCQSCGLRIGLAIAPALLAMLPAILLVLAIQLRWLRDPTAMIGLGLFAMTALVLLHLAVPLVKREITYFPKSVPAQIDHEQIDSESKSP